MPPLGYVLVLTAGVVCGATAALLPYGASPGRRPHWSGVGGCVSPPADGYARLRLLDRSGPGKSRPPTLHVERVRAADGHVLGAFDVGRA